MTSTITIDLRSFKLLTFDVVGTLIDFERGILDSVRQIGGERAAGSSDEQIFAAYLRGREANLGPSSQAMAHVYLGLARELGLPDDPQAADAFQLQVLRWPPFADTLAALRRLRRHYRLVAMTNADRVAFSAYAQTLQDPFDDAVTSSETGVHKPDPRFFAFNLGRQSAVGYKQRDILHVAQSQYHDIGVARDLDYAVCWIERRQGQPGFGGTPVPPRMTTPDLHFATLEALADAVDAAFAG